MVPPNTASETSDATGDCGYGSEKHRRRLFLWGRSVQGRVRSCCKHGLPLSVLSAHFRCAGRSLGHISSSAVFLHARSTLAIQVLSEGSSHLLPFMRHSPDL